VVAQASAVKVFRAEPDPVPGIFLMLAHHLDVTGEAEKLHRFETAAIHLLGDRQHRAGFHSERPET